MAAMRDYVVHLCATALICTVILNLTKGSSTIKVIIKLLCGIVLTYSIIQPIKQLKVSEFEKLDWNLQEEADRAMEQGKSAAKKAWAESIEQGTETYILEKAQKMDVTLSVEVELSDDNVPVPVGVSLTGQIAPYAKVILSDMIEQELNISKENQTWISR